MSTPPSDPPRDRRTDPRPIVGLPKAGLSNLAIAAIAIVLVVLLFIVLTTRRLDRANRIERPAESSIDAFPSPPALELPPEAPLPQILILPPRQPPAAIVPYARPSQPMAVLSAQPFAMTPPTSSPPSAPPKAPRMDAPAIVFDHGAIASGAAPSQTGGPQTASASSGDEDAPIATTVIRNHTTIMPTGTVIPAVLETPIDSTRPGLVRAVVSDDARGFDGKRVLIPRGSRLIGEYASDIRSGQKRVLVTWTRLIRPDGVAIRIGSPAADALGGAGIPGRVNTYFLQRFASAVLQSALQVGVNLASRPGNGSVIVGLPSTSGGTIGQDLIPSSDLKPRIRVKEGASLTIFVAHDLDFSGTPLVGRDRPS